MDNEMTARLFMILWVLLGVITKVTATRMLENVKPTSECQLSNNSRFSQGGAHLFLFRN